MDRIKTPKTALAYARMVKLFDPLANMDHIWVL